MAIGTSSTTTKTPTTNLHSDACQKLRFAQAIADVLWELKKADKLATLTSIAARAGFSPGVNGRTVITTLKIVRRDWPHLQWWRAVADNGRLDEVQKDHLAKAGYGSETVDGGDVVKAFSEQLMTWEESVCE